MAAAAYGAVQVNVTATLIRAKQTPTGQAKSLVVFNNGPNVVYLGGDASVTSANGLPVYPRNAVTFDRELNSDVYAICSVLQVTPADTRWMSEMGAQ